MIMLNKSIIGICGTGLFGATMISSYIYLTGDYTIEQLLKKEDNKKTKITSENKQSFLEKWEKYIKENSNSDTPKDKDILILDGWAEISKDKSKLPDALLKKCNSLFVTKVKNKEETKYINFVKWCTK